MKAIISDFDIRFSSKQVPAGPSRSGKDDAQPTTCTTDLHLLQICTLTSNILFHANDGGSEIESLLVSVLSSLGILHEHVASTSDSSSSPPAKKRAKVTARKQASKAKSSKATDLDVAV